MRILVTGSRDWEDYSTLQWALYGAVHAHVTLHPELNDKPTDWVTIVHGACPTGADRMADKYASECGWNIERHPADWKQFGKRAGPLRNAKMVDLGADLCLAFIRNNSSGAWWTAKFAEEAGIPTVRYTA